MITSNDLISLINEQNQLYLTFDTLWAKDELPPFSAVATGVTGPLAYLFPAIGIPSLVASCFWMSRDIQNMGQSKAACFDQSLTICRHLQNLPKEEGPPPPPSSHTYKTIIKEHHGAIAPDSIKALAFCLPCENPAPSCCAVRIEGKLFIPLPLLHQDQKKNESEVRLNRLFTFALYEAKKAREEVLGFSLTHQKYEKIIQTLLKSVAYTNVFREVHIYYPTTPFK